MQDLPDVRHPAPMQPAQYGFCLLTYGVCCILIGYIVATLFG